MASLEKPIRGLQLAKALAEATNRPSEPRPPCPATDDQRRYDSLTAMERTVQGLLAEDLPNKLIARQLDLSVRTVETHRAHLIEKLGTHSKVAMREFLVRLGLR